mgnify:CR=1 FL=1
MLAIAAPLGTLMPGRMAKSPTTGAPSRSRHFTPTKRSPSPVMFLKAAARGDLHAELERERDPQLERTGACTPWDHPVAIELGPGLDLEPSGGDRAGVRHDNVGRSGWTACGSGGAACAARARRGNRHGRRTRPGRSAASGLTIASRRSDTDRLSIQRPQRQQAVSFTRDPLARDGRLRPSRCPPPCRSAPARSPLAPIRVTTRLAIVPSARTGDRPRG